MSKKQLVVSKEYILNKCREFKMTRKKSTISFMWFSPYLAKSIMKDFNYNIENDEEKFLELSNQLYKILLSKVRNKLPKSWLFVRNVPLEYLKMEDIILTIYEL